MNLIVDIIKRTSKKLLTIYISMFVGWILAAFCGLGVFYFVLCIPLLMWINTSQTDERDGKKASPAGKKTSSAYSVFNKNCKKLKGDLDAESIDRHLRGKGF